jgi:hypothetical protein
MKLYTLLIAIHIWGRLKGQEKFPDGTLVSGLVQSN